MFLPLIIAILLGIASPSDTSSNSTSNSDTTGSLSDDETPGDDTGGEIGHTPIRN
jgi:hypothetical protein